MIRRFMFALAVSLGLAMGYGVVAIAGFPSGGVLGRQAYHGYFTNANITAGTFVFPSIYGGEAFPSGINNANAFYNFIVNTKLGLNGTRSSAQDKTGAAFIIDSMLGYQGSAASRRPSNADITRWHNILNSYEAAGRIDWHVWDDYTVNSFYQGSSSNDDAFFGETSSQFVMKFTNPDGTLYEIKWRCANPVGKDGIYPPALHGGGGGSNYDMSGSVTVSDATPHAGNTINFDYYLKNSGDDSSPTHIWAVRVDGLTGAALIASSDTGTYGHNVTKHILSPERVTIPLGTPAGTKYCRDLGFDPVNGSGARFGNSPVVCAVVQPDFGLIPTINAVVTDSSGNVVTDGFAEQGDGISFTYAVTNSGAGDSDPTTCDVYQQTFTGYHAAPAPPEDPTGPGWSPDALSTGCPRIFPHTSTTTLLTETIPASAIVTNHSICREIVVDPAYVDGTSKSAETCVLIGSKPYFQVYGGDVSAGNPQLDASSGACSAETSAAIVSWNKENPSFQGAGTQYAAYALSDIFDFATSVGTGSGAAAPPSNLAFANTAIDNPGHTFGGVFGSNSLPCIQDYYARHTDSGVQGFTDFASMGSGEYFVDATALPSGAFTIPSLTINRGQNTTLFVKGNVIINGDITYQDTWASVDQIPLFMLVVQGNIYIDRNVKQTDGVYVAQPNSSGSQGAIYTCTNGGAPYGITDGEFTAHCNTKTLTVNGSFVARQVYLLRADGTLAQTGGSDPRGEVFNYNPSAWITIPKGVKSFSTYDSATGLPPIL